MSNEPTFETIRDELDYEWDKPSTVAVIGSYVVGPNVKRIAAWSGMSRAALAEPARRLRENRIWVGGKVATETGEVPDGIEAIMQMMVADGVLEVAS